MNSRALERRVSVEALAQSANEHHAAALRSAEEAFEHARCAGDALLQIQQRVAGRWNAWVAENFVGHKATAQRYMALAQFHALIPDESRANLTTALEWVKAERLSRKSYPDEVKELAFKLLATEELSYRQIAGQLGISRRTVEEWSSRGRRAHTRQVRAQREKAARAALKREEEARAVAAIGGGPAEAYSLIRRTAQVLDRAAFETESREVRAGLNAALAKVHAAEDEVVRALGVSS